jgi:hypothetical protein
MPRHCFAGDGAPAASNGGLRWWEGSRPARKRSTQPELACSSRPQSSTRLSNGGYGHGDGIRARLRTRKGRAKVGRSGRWRARPRPLPVTQGATYKTGRSSNGGARAVACLPRTWPRVGGSGIMSSTRQALAKPSGGAMLGPKLAELDYGLIVKVVHLSMLYIFYLGVIVIRALD